MLTLYGLSLRMNHSFKYLLTALLLSLISVTYSAGPVLKVAVDNFSPPFVMRGANNQFYGFDIAVMESICEFINRTCVYQPMIFIDLIGAVETKTADVAIGAITITNERAERINFSTPYMVSTSLFIGLSSLNKPDFTVSSLTNLPTGVLEDTIYPEVLTSLGFADDNIIQYPQPEAMIEALQSGKIKAALMDAPAALYWQSQASSTLATLGTPLSYGFGLGIAINRNNVTLLQQINQAIILYQNSPLFKDNYNRYLTYF